MPIAASEISAVRRFGRFYTAQLGLLNEGLLQSPLTLTEGRVLYEVARQVSTTSTDISRELRLDPGYVSRLLQRLTRRGLVRRERSPEDRRRFDLTLSSTGRGMFDQLNAASDEQARALLSGLPRADRPRLLTAMATIEEVLGDRHVEDEPPVRYTLRPHRPGDIGWVVERHGVLYERSHGWDGRFEAMCAEIGARFLRNYDPRSERSWVAEIDGERVGAIFLVRRSKHVGQLRFLFVEPTARGLGLGARLVSECVGQARHFGYRRMTLFTVRGLDAARRLYEAEGFELAREKPGEGWAEGSIEQQWDLKL